MKSGTILSFLFLTLAYFIAAEQVELTPDCYNNFTQIATSYGYPSEIYEVHTEDGYILKVFRIPHGKDDAYEQGRPVIFVQHGLSASAENFVVNSEDKMIAFILADAGFDVWFGNSRGTYYSLEHETLDNTSQAYWNFTWVEMGRYDIPAVVDFVLKHTGQAKLTYLGHSQGTTQLFVGLSQKTEWFKERLHSFVALGPVARLAHSKSTFFSFFAKFDWPFEITDALNIYSLFPRSDPSWLSYEMCELIPITCEAQWWLTSEEYPLTYLNQPRVPIAKCHSPNYLGVKDVQHYAQVIKSSRFQYFDYGAELNQAFYNQDTPPLIPLTNIQDIPIGLFVGKTDELATVIDNEWLKGVLEENNSLGAYHEYEFGHIAFYLGKDLSYFMQDVLPFIKSHIGEAIAEIE